MSEGTWDDELLAPPGVDSDSDERLPWDPAMGFTDARRCVRIWMDDEHHIDRVEVSPRWKERIAGRPLRDAFLEALTMASVRFEDSGPLTPPELVPAEVGPFTSAEAVQDAFRTLLERQAELASRPPEDVRWADFVGEPAEGSARGRVTVRLSLAGLVEQVDFDRQWLEQASHTEIAEHVLEASRQAYRRYLPPTYVPGEHEELASELLGLSRAIESVYEQGVT